MEALEYYFLLVLLSHAFHAVSVGAAQITPSDLISSTDFISLDCGAPEGSLYTDEDSGIEYISDARFIDTGVTNGDGLEREYVRSFPQGIRNCYILRPSLGNSTAYLIRATFNYGSLDSNNTDSLPQFDLHLGADYWDTVKSINSTLTLVYKEINYAPLSGIIHVCLVNTGLGTPFISSLELRPLSNIIYPIELALIGRWNLGDNTTIYRYPDDFFDRRWLPGVFDDQIPISTTPNVDLHNARLYKPPSGVMSTAVIPGNSSKPLTFRWSVENSTDNELFYAVFYFAEIQQLQPNQSRAFYVNIKGDNEDVHKPYTPIYMVADVLSYYIFPTTSSSYLRIEITLDKTENSTLPPIINALELFKVLEFSHSQTDEQDTNAVLNIKSMYNITRNWQGDPCAPKDYIWDGLNCSYNNTFEIGVFKSLSRIVSLNLSSSELPGTIPPVILNLTVLQILDLSSNNLTGQVPEFLADHPSLKIINLKGNNFTGPIPSKLLKKSQHGLLKLSTDDVRNDANDNHNMHHRDDADDFRNNAETCKNSACKKGNKVIVSVLATAGALFLLLTSLAVVWIIGRKIGGATNSNSSPKWSQNKSDRNDFTLEARRRRFTYSEILKITNNLQQVIGRGGFGTVYHGSINGTEVAVKMFSSSLDQGLKELQSEANVLMNVHHKNLTSLIGYCIDEPHVGIIYEYMANGDLKVRLSDKNLCVLSWQERLQISIDAAQGLEYMHHGCKPPIVHRDVKSTNILLNEKFEAKIADFGLCRTFPTGTVTHVSTNHIAGTRGYLDPESCNTFRLTERSDVYSFGVVLLEIITSRQAIIASEPENPHVAQWVSSSMEATGDVKDIVDPRLIGEYDINSVRKVVEIAMACLSYDSSKRPTMSQVVMELKECLPIGMTRQEVKPVSSMSLVDMSITSSLLSTGR